MFYICQKITGVKQNTMFSILLWKYHAWKHYFHMRKEYGVEKETTASFQKRFNGRNSGSQLQ